MLLDPTLISFETHLNTLGCCFPPSPGTTLEVNNRDMGVASNVRGPPVSLLPSLGTPCRERHWNQLHRVRIKPNGWTPHLSPGLTLGPSPPGMEEPTPVPHAERRAAHLLRPGEGCAHWPPTLVIWGSGCTCLSASHSLVTNKWQLPGLSQATRRAHPSAPASSLPSRWAPVQLARQGLLCQPPRGRAAVARGKGVLFLQRVRPLTTAPTPTGPLSGDSLPALVAIPAQDPRPT